MSFLRDEDREALAAALSFVFWVASGFVLVWALGTACEAIR